MKVAPARPFHGPPSHRASPHPPQERAGHGSPAGGRGGTTGHPGPKHRNEQPPPHLFSFAPLRTSLVDLTQEYSAMSGYGERGRTHAAARVVVGTNGSRGGTEGRKPRRDNLPAALLPLFAGRVRAGQGPRSSRLPSSHLVGAAHGI